MTATNKPIRHYLKNPHGWVFVYEVRGDTVRIVRNWKGETVTEDTVTREQARQDYQCRQRQGFVSPNTKW